MLLKLGGILFALSMATAGTVGVFTIQSGLLVVDVRDKVHDQRVYIPVPMFLINTGVAMVPSDRLQEFQQELGPHAELLQAAGRELLNCPDGSFVEVESPDAQVSIAKKGRNLYVDVNSREETVHIQIPIASTANVLAQLASAD